MAYNETPITEESALAVISAWPRLKQSQLLDIMRGPLEYYTEDGPEDEPQPHLSRIYKGDVIPRAHLDLSAALGALAAKGKIEFTPKGVKGGWRVR